MPVSICTPNYTHLPIAIKAFQEGSTFLVEKPIAVNHQQARKMILAAQKAGRVLMVHHNMRFDPAVRTAEKLLQRKIIGKVFAFKASLTHQGPRAWRCRRYGPGIWGARFRGRTRRPRSRPWGW